MGGGKIERSSLYLYLYLYDQDGVLWEVMVCVGERTPWLMGFALRLYIEWTCSTRAVDRLGTWDIDRHGPLKKGTCMMHEPRNRSKRSSRRPDASTEDCIPQRHYDTEEAIATLFVVARTLARRPPSNHLCTRDFTRVGTLIEAGLFAGKVSKATTVEGAAATTATATAASTTTTAIATATTEAATTATTAATTAKVAATATTAAKATTRVIVGTLRGVVETNGATRNLSTIEALVGCLGLVKRSKLDVAESLGGTSLAVGRETHTLNGAIFPKHLLNRVLISVERNVSDEQGRAWFLGLIAVALGTLGAALLRSISLFARGTGFTKIDAQRATIELVAVPGLQSGGGVVGIDKLNVAESLAPARLPVGDDANALELAKFFKLAGEPLFVDVPGQVAAEQVGSDILLFTVDSHLALLGSLRRGGLLSLALLAGLLFDLWLFFFTFAGVAIRDIGRGVRVLDGISIVRRRINCRLTA